MKVRSLEHAIEFFVRSALEQEKYAFEDGSAKKYNKCSGNIAVCIKWLYKNDLLYKLTDFYEHQSKIVRCWAARYLLELDTENSIKVLEKLVEEGYFNAQYVLKEWKEGTLDMDFFKQ